jgi:hypothetical protein
LSVAEASKGQIIVEHEVSKHAKKRVAGEDDPTSPDARSKRRVVLKPLRKDEHAMIYVSTKI